MQNQMSLTAVTINHLVMWRKKANRSFSRSTVEGTDLKDFMNHIPPQPSGDYPRVLTIVVLVLLKRYRSYNGHKAFLALLGHTQTSSNFPWWLCLEHQDLTRMQLVRHLVGIGDSSQISWEVASVSWKSFKEIHKTSPPQWLQDQLNHSFWDLLVGQTISLVATATSS